ncbi:MAG: lipid A export permease/ATP-binding protein MsbA [Spongiibacteraceae bacterium]|jgi:subfamily B ATP-binding cassette protein MsbA|nr:lipid A export permease/ATP-binding protein MsbA [Spongiibacteraceae bacterium]
MTSESKPAASNLAVYLRLLSYVRPYSGWFVLSIVGFVVFAASEPAQAMLMKVLVEALEQKDPDGRYYIPALLIGIYVVRGVGSFVGTYFLSVVSNRLVHDLRRETFNHLVRLPTRYYDDNNSGHIIAKIVFNTTQVTAAATDALKVIVREGATVIWLLAYVFYLNWKMSLVFLLIAPVIALIVRSVGRKLRKLSTKVQHSVGEVTQVCNEAVTGHRVVRSFGGEAYEIDRFHDASANNMRRALRMVKITSLNTPLLQLIVIMAMGLIVFLILQPHFLAEMSTGDYVAYLTAVALLPKPIRQLSDVNGAIQRGLAAAESVFEILDMPPETDTGTVEAGRLHGDIELRHLSYRYPGSDQLALDDVSVAIAGGTTVALVGRSGSGKSTLANLISRFYHHSDGEILIDGIPIGDYTLASLRRNIAVVTQTVTLFIETVANNIAYGSDAVGDMERIRAAARDAYALEFIEALPEGFDTIVGENGVKLSGGQKQRIAIARALLKNAPILILDEATSALDNESEKAIQMALEKAMVGRTTLIIAHRLSTIEAADTILVMDRGRIVEQGTHEELLARGQVYAGLHASGLS